MNKILLLSVSILSLISCTRNYEPLKKRDLVPDYTESPFSKPQWQEIENPLLKSQSSACELLQSGELNSSSSTNFRFLQKMYLSDQEGTQILANINIASSPFTKFYLGESLVVPTKKEFLDKAEEEFKAGRLSRTEWYALYLAYKTGIGYEGLMYGAINDKIVAAFPGVFGTDSSLKNTLLDSLILKASMRSTEAQTDPQSIQYSRMLLAPTKLFSGENWGDEQIKNRLALTAMLTSLLEENSTEEKQCALVLLHKQFAKLLSIKGYYSPVVQIKDERHSRVKKLSSSHKKFKRLPNYSRFSDAKANPIILGTEDIADYDPSQKRLHLNKLHSSEAANSSEEVAYLQNIVDSYTATSPALINYSPTQTYYLGDITKSPTALAPFEVHTLSLGLSTMALKNIATQYIHYIDADGKTPQTPEDVAGIVFGAKNNDIIRIQMKELVRLANTIVHWELSLNQFKAKPASSWVELHPSYTKETLAKLLGLEIFSLSEIEEIFPDGFDQAETLHAQLRKLQLPLSLLMLKFYKFSGCMSEVSYDIELGKVIEAKPCDQQEKLSAKNALNLLSTNNQSALLWQE